MKALAELPPVDAMPIDRATLADRVYDQLLALLLDGRFGGGDDLSEVALAERFAVSRTPVREALRRLEADGLVSQSPSRRAAARRFSREEIVETYEVRGILEAAAARSAAERLSDVELGELRRLCSETKPRTGRAWEEQERRFDLRLHDAVAAACGNGKLREEIQRYTKLIRRVRSLVGRSAKRLAQGHAEHERIVHALAARDGDAAAQAMHEHVASALRFVLADVTTTDDS